MTAPDSRIAAVTRGLGALLALTILEAGVPLGLTRFGHQPDWAHLADQLTGPDNGNLLLAAITMAGWAAWAWLTLAVAVELGAALRHRSAPRIRLLGAGQRIAAGLVTSIVLLLPTTGALAATASPAQAATLHLPQHTSTPVTVAAAQHAVRAVNSPTSSGAWTGPMHTVKAGDTLWELAEDYLGDGKRWHEIAHLNQGLPQHDGHPLTADTDELHVGWQLRLPHDARTHQSSTGQRVGHGTAPVHETVHTVRVGDTLSQIAQEDLGDADAYPLIAAANKDHVQSDGRRLTDPDLIYPGWELTIPQTGDASALPGPAGTSHAPAAGSGSHQGTPPGTGGTAAGPGTSSTSRPGASSTVPSSPASTPPSTRASSAATAATTPAPTASDPASTAPIAPPSTPPSPAATPTAQTSAAATATAAPERADASGELRVGAGITAVLAAGLLGGYAAKRTLQQRRRKPGETIAMPAKVSALEHALHHQAEPSAELLDLALRTLARQLPDHAALPELSGARITTDGVEIQADGEPLPPFTAATQSGWWRLDPGQDLLDPDEASTLDAPYPLLIVLGPLPSGGVLLANLGAHRPLLLDGEPEQVADVARAIALDAATCPWGRLLQIEAVGVVDHRLIPAMPTGRLHHTDTPTKAVRDLADQLLAAQQDPAEELPCLVVSADGLDADTAWQLADLLSRARAAPVAVVVPAGEHAGLFPDAHRLDCNLTTPQPAPVAGTEVILQRVTQTEYELLRNDLQVSEEDAAPAEEEWRQVPQYAVSLTDPDEVEADADAADEGPSRPVLSVFTAFTAVTDPAAVVPTPAQSHDDDTAEPAVASADLVEEPADTTDAGEAADASVLPQETGQVADAAPDAWEADPPVALDAPQVRLLGPIELTGPGGIGTGARSRRMAELAGYLLLYPNRARETAAEAMNPQTPWTANTITSRLSELRKGLGETADGTPRVGRATLPGHMPILHDVHCDWFNFEHLAKQGLAAGPAGVADLEVALALVRGRPFDGSTVSWAVPLQQEMVSRIIDIAHTVAHHRTATGFFEHARKAVTLGLAIEPAAELLVRDWVVLELRAGNRHALPRITAGLSAALRRLDVDMEPATETLLAQAYAKADSWTAAAS